MHIYIFFFCFALTASHRPLSAAAPGNAEVRRFRAVQISTITITITMKLSIFLISLLSCLHYHYYYYCLLLSYDEG